MQAIRKRLEERRLLKQRKTQQQQKNKEEGHNSASEHEKKVIEVTGGTGGDAVLHQPAHAQAKGTGIFESVTENIFHNAGLVRTFYLFVGCS